MGHDSWRMPHRSSAGKGTFKNLAYRDEYNICCRKIENESLLRNNLRHAGNGNRITFARGASYVAQKSKMNHCS